MKRLTGVRPTIPPLGRAEVDEEFAAHLAMRVDQLTANGWNAEEARREALRQFGNVDDAKHYCRNLDQEREDTISRANVLQDIGNDIRYGARSLRRAPVMAAMAVITLALGIGVNLAVFAMIRGTLLHPIPVPRANGLVALFQRDTRTGSVANQISYGDFTTLRSRSDLFDGVALIENASVTVVDDRGAQRVQARRVSPQLFQLTGARPLLGRLFAADMTSADEQSVVVSHAYWSTRLGSDSSMVGRTVRLGGMPHVIVGVLPPEFDLPYPNARNDLWLPLLDTSERTSNRNYWGYWAVARLHTGVAPAHLQSALDIIGARLEQEYAASNVGRRFTTRDLGDTVVGDRRTALFALAAAAAFVLLIAGTNMTNLTLVRSLARRQELAVRAALGAGRARLVRRLTIESLLLALGGAALAVGIALIMVRAGNTLTAEHIALGNLVLLLAGVLAFVGGIACGLWPALMSTRALHLDALRMSARVSHSRSQRRLADMLVGSQVALAFVLVASATLMLTTVTRALRADAGFNRRAALTLRVFPSAQRYADVNAVTAFYDRLSASLAAMPAVRAVAITSTLPFGNRMGSIATRELAGVGTIHDEQVIWGQVRPGYFATLGIPLLAGRDFSTSDFANPSHVTIVSASTAKRLFGTEDPIGQRISLGKPDKPDWHRIIGVVGDVRQDGVTDEMGRAVYDLFGQHWNRAMWVVVRSSGGTSALVDPIRRAIATIDPEMPMTDVSTLEERAASSIVDRRLVLQLLASFGAIALILCAVGIYGVTAQSVAQRAPELGIRLALGATARRVRRDVVRSATRIVGIGVVVGGVMALGATRMLRALLFGVTPADPLAFGVAGGVLLVVAMFAAWIPARRASRIDPVELMR